MMLSHRSDRHPHLSISKNAVVLYSSLVLPVPLIYFSTNEGLVVPHASRTSPFFLVKIKWAIPLSSLSFSSAIIIALIKPLLMLSVRSAMILTLFRDCLFTTEIGFICMIIRINCLIYYYGAKIRHLFNICNILKLNQVNIMTFI